MDFPIVKHWRAMIVDYLDITLDLSEEDLVIKEAAHKFAEEVMRPAAKKLEQLTPEKAIADDSPLWPFLKTAYELGYHKILLSGRSGGHGPDSAAAGHCHGGDGLGQQRVVHPIGGGGRPCTGWFDEYEPGIVGEIHHTLL